MTLENEPPRSEVVQYATGEEQKATANSSRNYKVAGPKWKRPQLSMSLVKVKSDAVKTVLRRNLEC